LPGESREITATYKLKDSGKSGALLAVDGWNVSSAITRVGAVAKARSSEQ